jgi:mercuric ion transport protein
MLYRNSSIFDLGLSSLHLSLIPTISPYKNIFIILTALMLGAAHLYMGKNTSKGTRTILWISTVIFAGLIIIHSF